MKSKEAYKVPGQYFIYLKRLEDIHRTHTPTYEVRRNRITSTFFRKSVSRVLGSNPVLELSFFLCFFYSVFNRTLVQLYSMEKGLKKPVKCTMKNIWIIIIICSLRLIT